MIPDIVTSTGTVPAAKTFAIPPTAPAAPHDPERRWRHQPDHGPAWSHNDLQRRGAPVSPCHLSWLDFIENTEYPQQPSRNLLEPTHRIIKIRRK
jgi:hypothetical protein